MRCDEYAVFWFDLKDVLRLRCLIAEMMKWNLTILDLPYISFLATRTCHDSFP